MRSSHLSCWVTGNRTIWCAPPALIMFAGTIYMAKSRKPLEIKISTVVAVSAILNDPNPDTVGQALKEMTGGTDDFFEDEFAVLDVGHLDNSHQIDWAKLVSVFRQYRLNTVAVRNAPEQLHAGIIACGLSIDSMADAAGTVNNLVVAPEPEPVVEAPPAPVAAPAAQTMIIDTPVRAGQRIYARGADLIVMASVNNGAEVIADGNIHVYAPLRGRALAGASGNTNARIFTTCMAAELVSIAGMYRTFDEGYPAGIAQQHVMIRLMGERIDVAALQGIK